MKIEIQAKEFNLILEKVKQLQPGNRSIKVGNAELIFRYGIVIIDGMLTERVQFSVVDPATPSENVISLVFDVKGLNAKFNTEIEFYKENDEFQMYIIPSRDNSAIERFRTALQSI